MYRYKLISTQSNSQKYGNCEICQHNVSEVFHQIEERTYKFGWTQKDCRNLFGHEKCLKVNQKKGE